LTVKWKQEDGGLARLAAGRKTFHGHGYVLADRSCKLTTHGSSGRAIRLSIDLGADAIRSREQFR
jgi:hypothetical protein